MVIDCKNTHAESAALVNASPQTRYSHLDGVRGLAALYVVLYHAYSQVDWGLTGRGIPHWIWRLSAPLHYGTYAVVVFIVLSGYCLTLPLVRGPRASLRLDFRRYVGRRAMRILPPYYAALALSLLVLWMAPSLQALTHASSGGLSSVVSHALLVHNLSPSWAQTINSPMWTVATEWQIYFLLPAFLLPVWRRWGLLWSVTSAAAAGALIGSLPGPWGLESAAPWYLGLFAFGMGAAAASVRTEGVNVDRLRRTALTISVLVIVVLLFPMVPIGPLGPVALLAKLSQAWFRMPTWATDFGIGGITCLWLVYFAQCVSLRARPGAEYRVVTSPWARSLGSFSYSIYLTHAPLLKLIHLPLLMWGWSPVARLTVLMTVGPAAAVAFARLFSAIFEQPFLRVREEKWRAT